MRAERVEFLWDENKSSWLIRIQTGEEVIQRHSALPKSVDEATLRTAVDKAVVDEGYDVDPESVIRVRDRVPRVSTSSTPSSAQARQKPRTLGARVREFVWPNNWWKRWQHWIGVVSAAALIYSLQYARHEFGIGFSKDDPTKVRQAIMLGFWIVVPPIWFWFEYYFLYKGGSAGLDEFKHGQDQSSKIWLALVTVLLGAYFGKDLIRDSPPAPPIKPLTSVYQQSPRGSQSAPEKGESSSTPQAPSQQ